jgi:hypothetical protein
LRAALMVLSASLGYLGCRNRGWYLSWRLIIYSIWAALRPM